MRVALFSRYPNDPDQPKGGVESVTVVLARALAGFDDLEVHVLTLEPELERSVVSQDGRITVHRLPGSSWPQMIDILIGPGRRRLIRCLQELHPDVLHTHETYGLALGNIPVPHVFTVHGFDHANIVADSARFGWIRSRLWDCVERRGFAAQRHIISITPYVRQMIEPLTEATIHDIDNPVDARFFQVERLTEAGRILCVGWINERKNTLGSVEAFAGIAQRHPNARLVIAGEAKEAEYFRQVQQSIDRNALANRIEILGHVNHAQLLQELARASVFLLPSRQENAPMAVAEAMAAGISVVASNRCGMPYMVQEGKTGFLIDPESNEQITERLARLLSSAPLCRQMAECGRRVAMERFHPRAVAEKTMMVYRALCAEHRTSHARPSLNVT